MTFVTDQWKGNETYLLLSADGGHPGNSSDAIRRWTAPQAGSISISGNASDANTGCGSGAAVYIKKNSTILWQQAIANGNTTGVNYNLATTVAAGDNIDFGINRGTDGYWNCDATNFDPTIVLTLGGGSSDTTGPAVAITSHSNNQTVTASPITVAGTASDSGLGNSGMSSVTVNGVAATGGTAAGSATANWSRLVTLNSGANTITVVAKDNSAAQNSSTVSITVNYSVTGALTFQASVDFSSTQGFRNWYYLYGSGTPMTFVTDQWKGNETYLLLSADGGHPGNSSDAIRRWTAPQAGSISISGNASDANTGCGSGAAVYIKKNSTILWQQAIANGNTTGVNYNLATTVAAGDNIDFGINRGTDGYWNCDATNFDPTIVLTP